MHRSLSSSLVTDTATEIFNHQFLELNLRRKKSLPLNSFIHTKYYIFAVIYGMVTVSV